MSLRKPGVLAPPLPDRDKIGEHIRLAGAGHCSVQAPASKLIA